jgi:hypothetical protein
MLVLRPRLHELVSTDDNRTLKQVEALGVDPAEHVAARQATVALALTPKATASQQLLARSCLDYILRLDPLVTQVRVSGLTEQGLGDLPERVPLEIADDGSTESDFSVAIGAGSDSDSDLVVDGFGWIASIGSALGVDESGVLNPVGPLAAAALAAGEVFKALFRLSYPDAPYSRRFVEASGVFSLFDYQYSTENPPLSPLQIDAFLVGCGGIGAAVVRALGELGEHVAGQLRLIDADVLSTDNLNRLTYARWKAAVDEIQKVVEAKKYLDERLPNLEVSTYACPFGEFKRGFARRRADRFYNVVITGLDEDEPRHEVQRDLPRVLIDAATGRDANITVERAVVGEWGCLGCTRQMNAVVDPDAECDDLPDARAPSVSFLSGLAGTLAAGELIKESGFPEAALRGSFDHIFVYGLNPDLRSEPSQSPTCRINCSDPSVVHAYRAKYGG